MSEQNLSSCHEMSRWVSVTCDSLKNCHLGSFYYFRGELFSQSCQDEGNLSPYSTSFHIRQGGSAALMEPKITYVKKDFFLGGYLELSTNIIMCF